MHLHLCPSLVCFLDKALQLSLAKVATWCNLQNISGEHLMQFVTVQPLFCYKYILPQARKLLDWLLHVDYQSHDVLDQRYWGKHPCICTGQPQQIYITYLVERHELLAFIVIECGTTNQTEHLLFVPLVLYEPTVTDANDIFFPPGHWQ